MDFANAINLNIENYFLKLLTLQDEYTLQLLCERCSDYYSIVEGTFPDKNASLDILRDLPPNKSYDDKFVFGIFNDNARLVGVIDLVRNYPVEGEWIIGLLMIDPIERGKGLGKEVHNRIKEWALKSKAEKLRIGVVEDNEEAYHFWSKLGYLEIKRTNMRFGNKDKVVIIMNYQL